MTTGSSSPEFVRPSGVWSPEMVPGAQDWQRFDVAQWKSVNGDLGGSWAPSKPIAVGGAGVALTTSGSLATGGVSTATGGRIIVAASAGDFPTLSPARTRTILVPLVGNIFSPADLSNPGQFQTTYSDQFGWGIKSVGYGTPIAISIPGRFVHAGARLASASLDYVVTALPAAVPTEPMYFVMCGSDDTGVNSQFSNPSWFSAIPAFTFGNLISWETGFAVSVGSYTVPSTLPKTTGFYYRVTTAGSGHTGSTEPTWPTTVGATTTPDSNGVVWTCVGLAGMSYAGNTTPAQYYANGQPQRLTLTTDGVGPGSPYSNTIDTAHRYQFIIESSDNNVLLTALTLQFDSISSLAFE